MSKIPVHSYFSVSTGLFAFCGGRTTSIYGSALWSCDSTMSSDWGAGPSTHLPSKLKRYPFWDIWMTCFCGNSRHTDCQSMFRRQCRLCRDLAGSWTSKSQHWILCIDCNIRSQSWTWPWHEFSFHRKKTSTLWSKVQGLRSVLPPSIHLRMRVLDLVHLTSKARMALEWWLFSPVLEWANFLLLVWKVLTIDTSTAGKDFWNTYQYRGHGHPRKLAYQSMFWSSEWFEYPFSTAKVRNVWLGTGIFGSLQSMPSWLWRTSSTWFMSFPFSSYCLICFGG